MGLSVTTMAGAKGITVAYVNKGLVTKDKAKAGAEGSGFLVKDDVKVLDLSKIQMTGRTFFALFVYLIRLWQEVSTVSLPVLPDIDAVLMVLMGLGEGAYLEKKLGTVRAASKLRSTVLAPGSGRLGSDITITGLALGDDQDGVRSPSTASPSTSPPCGRTRRLRSHFPPRSQIIPIGIQERKSRLGLLSELRRAMSCHLW